MTFTFNIFTLLLFSLAIILVFEGVLYSAFPNVFKKIMESFVEYNIDKIRIMGLSFLAIGLILIYVLVKFLI